MAKVKYYAKENSTIGTHSFYAVPIPNGTLSFDELLDEAMDGKSVEPSIAKACVTEFMKAVKRNVLKGFRCQLGDNFLTVYPNIQLSVKRILRTKQGDSRRLDYEKIIHICEERIRQIDMED